MTEAVFAVNFEPSISLGAALLGLLILFLSAFFSAFYTARSKAADVWKSEAEAEARRAERAEGERDAARGDAARSQAQVTKLSEVIETVGGAKVYEAIMVMQEEATRMMDKHEERAEERHAQRMKQAAEEHRQVIGAFSALGQSLADLSKQINGATR